MYKVLGTRESGPEAIQVPESESRGVTLSLSECYVSVAGFCNEVNKNLLKSELLVLAG